MFSVIEGLFVAFGGEEGGAGLGPQKMNKGGPQRTGIQKPRTEHCILNEWWSLSSRDIGVFCVIGGLFVAWGRGGGVCAPN